MDAFRQQAAKTFKEQIFTDRPMQYEVLKIVRQTSGRPALVTETLPVTVLQTSDWIRADSVEPSLMLIHIEYDAAALQRFHTSEEDMLRLFHDLDLDPYMLSMVYRDNMGYYQLPSRPAIWTTKEAVVAFFINVEPLKVLWSFNTSTCSVKGLILTRKTVGGRVSYRDFCQLLNGHVSLIAHPLLPCYCVVLDVMMFCDKIVAKQEEVISMTEAQTGYNPWSAVPDYASWSNSAEFEDLGSISQKMSGTMVELEDISRHMKIMARILASLAETDYMTSIVHVNKEAFRVAHEDISQVLSLLRPQLEYTEVYIGYLRERARNQLTVVFNLITKSDAQANINLAQAMSADGSSMKVIAIMTMSFLPGTFFAALFSVPSLQWGRTPVVQENFWIYWAFTIPCTAIVFVTWIILTKWQELKLRLISKY